MTFDSRPETWYHINKVQQALTDVVSRLQQRAVVHDQSKLQAPELDGFNEWTPRLRDLTYGSDEYKAALAALAPTLKHHYAHNSHHPEHYNGGMAGMDLLDLVEMFCDWYAASQRHADGEGRLKPT